MHSINGFGYPLQDGDIEGSPVDEITEHQPQGIVVVWPRPFELTHEAAMFRKLMRAYDDDEHLFFTHLGGISLSFARLHRFSGDRDVNTSYQQAMNYIGHIFSDLSRVGMETNMDELRAIVHELTRRANDLSTYIPNGYITAFQPARVYRHQIVFQGARDAT